MRYSYLGKRTEANGSFEKQGTDYKGTERIKGERNGLKVNGSGDLRFFWDFHLWKFFIRKWSFLIGNGYFHFLTEIENIDRIKIFWAISGKNQIASECNLGIHRSILFGPVRLTKEVSWRTCLSFRSWFTRIPLRNKWSVITWLQTGQNFDFVQFYYWR